MKTKNFYHQAKGQAKKARKRTRGGRQAQRRRRIGGRQKYLHPLNNRFFLFLDISALCGGHIGGPLVQNGLFNHVDSGGAENIAEPRPVGRTANVKGVFGETTA
jgi:hypothetical protein